jgi:hypothetical protein
MTTSAPGLVLLESDDYMHEHAGEPTYNESAYFNFFDPDVRLGGFVRIGNRPGEGHAEMTVCLYLPDGRVAFMFWRAELERNERFDAAGLRLEVVKPFAEHRISYDGTCCLLERPLDLLDPRRAFSENPHVPVSLELRYERLSDPFGGEPRERLSDGKWVSAPPPDRAEFARGHLEQHGRAIGSVIVAGAQWRVDGYGLRDRSWGPRTWQALERYRWLTMNFGPGAGIAAALVVQRDGQELHGGYIYRTGEPLTPLERVSLETEYSPDHDLHSTLSAILHPADGGDPQLISGRVLRMVPLRNRRRGVTTRIAEGLTEWRWNDRVGYGWSEYLDHGAAS